MSDEALPYAGWFGGKARPLPPCITDKLADWVLLVGARAVHQATFERVLDIGPCFGVDAEMFAPTAARYVALDRFGEVVDWVKSRTPEVEIVHSNAETLPFPDESFDLVIDFGTFDNCQEPAKCYAEAARVLAPRGILLTAYANYAFFQQWVSDNKDEIRQEPNNLVALLDVLGLDVYYRGGEEGPRASMAARKR